MLEQQRSEESVLTRTGVSVADWGQDVGAGLLRFCRSKPLGAAGGIITILLITMAILANVIAPYQPKESLGRENVHLRPQLSHIMGTDHAGRDVLSRVIHGARISLYVGFGSVTAGIALGFILAVVTTYAGGFIDLSFQRLVDSLMALPGLIIALAIVAVLGSSLQNVMVAIVVGMLAPVIRTVRSQVLTTKELDYILAARAIGASPLRLVFRHIAPNCMAIALVVATPPTTWGWR